MAATSNPSVTLPIVTIRLDFTSVISDVQSGIVPYDSFWLSCYKEGSSSVHGKVKAELDDDDPRREKVKFTGQEGVSLASTEGNPSYLASCPALSIVNTPLSLPIQEYEDPKKSHIDNPQRIVTFDVSPDKSQVTTGFLDGTVAIYSISPPSQTIASSAQENGDGTKRKVTITPYATAKVHLSSVTSLRFFPSSKVILSGGADFILHILPANNPPPNTGATASLTPDRITPARSLRGHTRPISDTAIIARGRNVLSSSLDGTIRLWDVGSGEQIRILSSVRGPILSMSLGERGQTAFLADAVNTNGNGVEYDEREVETRDKLVFCSLQNGSIECFDLSTKRSVMQSSRSPSSLSSISYSSRYNLLATGSTRGLISVYDTQALSNSTVPLVKFKRNESSVEDVSFMDMNSVELCRHLGIGLAIATADGLPYVAGSFGSNQVRVAKELVGVDCDAVRCVRTIEGEVWIAGDDAVLRRYAL
ncbi:hypothetical protein ONZ45_g3258 [Pleurotus djamor]|nr:hypothetical protein ONZ45_g3258 [Pleurotus djamor]